MAPSNDVATNSAEAPLVEASTTPSGKVRILTLTRPRALNAVSRKMASQLFEQLRVADADDNIRVVIITGSGRAFCAGADIKELKDLSVESAFVEDWLHDWNHQVMAFRKPLIAAINGFAFGGGAEIAMMCDILHCGKSARIGLPEVTLGTIPGAGGTQRLTQAIGKSRAFEMILTGEPMMADEAYERGLVSKVFEDAELLKESTAFAEKIAEKSSVTLRLAKRAINATQKPILDGLPIEKQLYHMSFGTESFAEGVSAFVEKRKANF